jgi:hypothetical protein
VSEKDFALERAARERLRELHVHLQVAHASVVVAAAALHWQNADRDEEIARVLEYCVALRLAAQIERTAEFLAALQPVPTDPNDLESWDPRPRPGST